MIIQFGLFLGSYVLLIVLCRLLMSALERMSEMKDRAEQNRNTFTIRMASRKRSKLPKDKGNVMVHKNQSLP